MIVVLQVGFRQDLTCPFDIGLGHNNMDISEGLAQDTRRVTSHGLGANSIVPQNIDSSL